MPRWGPAPPKARPRPTPPWRQAAQAKKQPQPVQEAEPEHVPGSIISQFCPDGLQSERPQEEKREGEPAKPVEMIVQPEEDKTVEPDKQADPVETLARFISHLRPEEGEETRESPVTPAEKEEEPDKKMEEPEEQEKKAREEEIFKEVQELVHWFY